MKGGHLHILICGGQTKGIKDHQRELLIKRRAGEGAERLQNGTEQAGPAKIHPKPLLIFL